VDPRRFIIATQARDAIGMPTCARGPVHEFLRHQTTDRPTTDLLHATRLTMYDTVRVYASAPKSTSVLCQNCVRYPLKPRANTGGHADAHRCCGKSLIGSALVGFCVRQHARAESISKRA
jgi:hypothetical protein